MRTVDEMKPYIWIEPTRPPSGLVPRVRRHRRYSSSRAERLASRRGNDSHGKERSGIRLFLQKIQGRHQCVKPEAASALLKREIKLWGDVIRANRIVAQ